MVKEERLLLKQQPWHAWSGLEVLTHLRTSNKGLNRQSVLVRIIQAGHNQLPTAKRPTVIDLFISQFKSPLVLVLLAAAVITLFIKQWTDAGVILAAVLANGLVGFGQEYKAEHTLQELNSYLQYYARVRRDNILQQVLARDVVPGDIVYLQAGDQVPADGRLLETQELEINEAALTGEVEPAVKSAGKLPENTVIADRVNMAYQGSTVTRGNGLMVVVATGRNTQLGRIAEMLAVAREKDTPLQFKLNALAKTIGLVVIVICLFIWLVGWYFSYGFVTMFTLAVAIAVSAVPEGLAVAVTAILAVGMRRILQKQALARKLVAAETLGSTTVICADKTGTLTAGEMRLSQLVLADATGNPQVTSVNGLALSREILLGGILNSEAYEQMSDNGGDKIVVGSPTERSLYLAAVEAGINVVEERHNHPRLKILPFNSERKLMATLHESSKAGIVYVKGAPESLIDRCAKLYVLGKAQRLTPQQKQSFIKQAEELSSQGYRLLALAKRNLRNIKIKDFELSDESLTDLILVGLAVLHDPLRPQVRQTINRINQAGLRLIMITGDHKLTAQAVAAQAGLPAAKENILSGEELTVLTDEQLVDKFRRVTVVARATPLDKLRIVKILQNEGEVVAMTGDGVNDAPALQAANIGIALGSGTDVARQASDLVLLNNDLSTIVAAIDEGRTIYANIRKVLLYLMSDTFAEVFLIGAALLWSAWNGQTLLLPILATQILWVNLVADTFPTLALAVDPPRPDNMLQLPVSLSQPMLDISSQALIAGLSLFKGLGGLAIFLCLNIWLMNSETSRTVVFSLFALSTPFYSFSLKQLDSPVWNKLNWNNKYLVVAVVGIILLQLLVVYSGLGQSIFHTVPLSGWQWLIIVGFSLLLTAVAEVLKWILKKRQAFK